MEQALISVFDKRGVVELARALQQHGVSIISTGGTFKTLTQEGVPVTQVSDITHFPEILDGRVKTLHPHIHGGLLAKTNQNHHVEDLNKHGIKPIQLVATNLYPFEQTVAQPNISLDVALENIDIGGVAMIRAAAKNFEHVLILVDPSDYTWVIERVNNGGGLSSITLSERKKLALKAFQHTASYDSAISSYLASVDEKGVNTKEANYSDVEIRRYEHEFTLKYGCNPHQNPSGIFSVKGHPLPFKVLNGTPGYINLLDALNAWQLVKELKQSTGLAAAASFKHVSPAGAAVSVPLTQEEREIYEVGDKQLTDASIAYIRARNADPIDVVDEATAQILKIEVSDGIIAPGFEEKALEVLKAKKGGKYIVIQVDPNYNAPLHEFREVFGVVFAQKRNDTLITLDHLKDVVTKKKELSDDAKRDLLVATITLKYTQSNSVGYAKNGMMIGVGAGQQSRVDCAKLAGKKLSNWWLRFHPKIRGIKFNAGTKRVDRINTRVHVIDDTLSSEDNKIMTEPAQTLTQEEKDQWLSQLHQVSLSSDAFFPFRDSIDVCSKLGVDYIAQPGGSVQDDNVTQACDEYGMVMANTGVRLFHH
ncbi:putative bifunctional purine biosynthesis protein PURH [Planoprotostelium fungivorum]|uniref:Putative bifunctional purine biosynthesis protein PURH n=1 Tax=Planoprotostelium fungivorum TaxID=1890364 RepID=A0A2P6NKT1_9EUKA|nr:putative bifunctional purine biosynthesis protein PURH [Planoprotostelium fungivorum]